MILLLAFASVVVYVSYSIRKMSDFDFDTIAPFGRTRSKLKTIIVKVESNLFAYNLS